MRWSSNKEYVSDSINDDSFNMYKRKLSDVVLELQKIKDSYPKSMVYNYLDKSYGLYEFATISLEEVPYEDYQEVIIMSWRKPTSQETIAEGLRMVDEQEDVKKWELKELKRLEEKYK